MRPGWRRIRRPARGGQALVEFAIVLPVLFLILAGIIQFGLIFWTQNTLTQVVRDTGRWAATQQTRPCAGGGEALVNKADEIARTSGLLGYTAGEWNGVPAPFDDPPSREGIQASWPLTTDQEEPDPSDCPPDTNQIAWFVNIRAQHEVPLFLPLIGQFIPSCDADSCSLSSAVQFRMEPSR